MSIEIAKAFIERVKGDKVLYEKLRKLSEDSEATVEQRLKIAADAGFIFTSEHFVAASTSTGDLSDAELENVSGGYEQDAPKEIVFLDDFVSKIW